MVQKVLNLLLMQETFMDMAAVVVVVMHQHPVLVIRDQVL
jgi:hypothetical protein